MTIHLRSHSYYSFLRGLSSPAELAQAAAAAGMPALALTDTTTLCGAVEFYDACHAAGILPILGLEFELALPASLAAIPFRAGKVALLAMNMAGWSSLCRLSSFLLTDAQFENNPFLPFDQLQDYADGVLCLTGGARGLPGLLARDGRLQEAGMLLAQLEELFAGCLYVELQRHVPEDEAWTAALAGIARQNQLPIVATHDIHYLRAESAQLQKVVTAMRLNCRLQDVPQEQQAPTAASFLSQDEMAQRFAGLPEALAATHEVAERCRLELPLGLPHFPEIEPPVGMTLTQVLRQKAEAGARRLYGDLTASIQSRLDHELGVIETCGYAVQFLVMEEILQYARRMGVPFSSRGSAASSLVAHCLGITSPDPLRLNLYFERFLNPARFSPPDIDTDLCSRRRDEVIRFVYERYGADRVAMVCTVNRFRSRSALREVAKAYGLPAAEISKLADELPYRWYGPPPPGYNESAPFGTLAERYPSSRHQAVFRDAAALIDKPRHLSVHPGGVVIAPGRLTDLVPTQMASKGVVITQFDLHPIERLGLVKIDLLGIRGLTVLGDVLEVMQTAQPERFASSLDALDLISEDDPATSELVQHGRTIGCFQIESPGMRATLKEIQAKTVDDLMVALALYRPGPLTGGLKDAFVRRHRGEEQVTHLHPALSSLLEDTHGVILYQEQVLRIAHELAGLSLQDADLLRRAMSHFDPGKQMQTLKEKFVGGAMQHSRVPADVAGRVWELMIAFAGYGFPKAHAASYAQIAWRLAWCKAHHPAVFIAAVLANWGGYYGQQVYMTEARRMGFSLRPPHVNYARREFSVVYDQGETVLYMGLDQVRELTHRTIGRIIKLRPFSSLDDFLSRVDPRPVEVENLAQCGALRGFGTIPGLLQALKGDKRRRGQLALFALEETDEVDWSLEERVAAQETILGVGVDAHPLELFADRIREAKAITTLDAAAQVGKQVSVAGMRQTWRRVASQTGPGDHLYLMSLEDLEGMLEVLIPSDVYRRGRSDLSTGQPFVVEGVMGIAADNAEPFLRASRIRSL